MSFSPHFMYQAQTYSFQLCCGCSFDTLSFAIYYPYNMACKIYCGEVFTTHCKWLNLALFLQNEDENSYMF